MTITDLFTPSKRLSYAGLSLLFALLLSIAPSPALAEASETEANDQATSDEYTDASQVPMEYTTEVLDHFILKLPKMVKPEIGKESLTQLEAAWCYANFIIYDSIIDRPLTENARRRIHTATHDYAQRCPVEKLRPHQKFGHDLFNPHLFYMTLAPQMWLAEQYRWDGIFIDPSKLSPKQIKLMQTYLAEKGEGFFKGTPDGIYDEKTQKAVTDFQEAAQIKAKGRLTFGTLYMLGFTYEDLDLPDSVAK